MWLKLTKAVLEENRDSLSEFAVLFFNVETFWWKQGFVENTAKNTAALMEFADGLALEGATDLGAALSEATHKRWDSDHARGARDLFLLSDGAATWGESDLYALSSRLDGDTVFSYRIHNLRMDLDRHIALLRVFINGKKYFIIKILPRVTRGK